MPEIISHYRIIRQLGAGGMGEIFLAEDTRLDRTVALKVLPAALASDPERKRRLILEAKAASALNHPNVCIVYEIAELEDGRPFIAMEYIEGQTLESHITGSPLGPQEVLNIATQIAEALNAAHAKGITHRDIKPSNVMITPDGRVKVLDFGLAKFGGTAGDMSTAVTGQRTQSGAILGTLAYMSPEQTMGLEADHRSDIFSFGALLSEMTKSAPAGLDRLIRKCLERDRDRRYQNTRDLLRDLQKLQRPSRSRAVIAVTLMLLPLLLAALFSYWSNHERPTEISSVVVLPAKVFGASDLAYLTDAVPSTLSTHLAGIEGLETKVPPTSIEFEKIGGDYKKIADAYGVNVVVLTAITADAGLFQLNLQLIDPRTRRVIWSNPYQGPRGKYLELVQAAGEGLRRALKPGSSPVTTSAGVASSSEAELAFRQGEHFRDRFNYLHQAGDFDAAFAAFKRALDLDPRLADAAAEISRLYVMKLDATGPTPELISDIETWGRKALVLNPRCGRAYFTLASAEQWRPKGDIRKVLSDSLRGASFDPQYAPTHTIVAVGLNGALTLSMEATREARKLDPLYLYAPMFEAGNLNQLGRPAEALDLVDRSILSIEPDMGYGLWVKGLLLVELDRPDEAEQLVNRVGREVAEGRLMPFAESTIRLELAAARKQHTAVEKLLDEVLRTPKAPFEWQLIASLAPPLAWHGQVDAAFRLMQRAVEGGVTLPYDVLRLNPRLEVLRKDPRFQPILVQSRKQFDEMMHVLDEARSRGELPKYLEKPLTDLRVQLGL